MLELILLSSIFLVVPAPGTGTIHSVLPDGQGPYPTIQAAIDSALAGDVIELADGVFAGAGNRELDFRGKALILRSQNGDPGTCVIDCGNGGRALWFHSGESADALVLGITIRSGLGKPEGGAILCEGIASPTIAHCTFSGNRAERGGAIACRGGSGPAIIGCDFSGNQAKMGGAICAIDLAHPSLEHCRVTGNQAEHGGAIAGVQGASPQMSECLVVGNRATKEGGAVWCQSSSPTVSQCTLADNHGQIAGGGIAARDMSAVSLEKSIIVFSTAGGAVSCDANSVAIVSCCNIFGNAGGDWDGAIANRATDRGNSSQDPLFCSELYPPAPRMLRSDSPCAPQQTRGCGRIGARAVGCDRPLSDAEEAPGSRLFLQPIGSNPFAPPARIDYGVPASDGPLRLSLAVFDLQGRLVRRLVDRPHGPGTFTATWDGRDVGDRPVADGLYFCRLRFGEHRLTRQLLLIR